jgi:hypothetical protein
MALIPTLAMQYFDSKSKSIYPEETVIQFREFLKSPLSHDLLFALIGYCIAAFVLCGVITAFLFYLVFRLWRHYQIKEVDNFA